MIKPIWKKQRGTDLSTLWDGESSWCLIMGLAAYGVTPCRLSHYPPQESSPLISQTFDVVTDHEPTVRDVLEQIANAADCCMRASVALGMLDGTVIAHREMHDRRQSEEDYAEDVKWYAEQRKSEGPAAHIHRVWNQ
jgi:hypothetical protein